MRPSWQKIKMSSNNYELLFLWIFVRGKPYLPHTFIINLAIYPHRLKIVFSQVTFLLQHVTCEETLNIRGLGRVGEGCESAVV